MLLIQVWLGVEFRGSKWAMRLIDDLRAGVRIKTVEPGRFNRNAS